MIKLGIIGTGIIVREKHLPVLSKLNDKFKVSSILTRSATNCRKVLAAELSANHGIQLFEDFDSFVNSGIEAVLVATPISLLGGDIERSLSSGKHVFAEKPLTDSLELAQSLIKLAEEKQRVLFVGENYRYQPQYQQVHKIVSEGIIGKALVYKLNDLHYSDPGNKYAQTAWRQEGKFVGGYLLDGGTHISAGMREMVKSPVIGIHGLATAFHPEYLSAQSDTLLLNLKFANGMIGQMALGWGSFDPEARKPKVYGTEGTLILNKDRIEIWRPCKIDAPSQIIQAEISESFGFEEEWLDFHKILSSTELLQSGWQEKALEAVKDMGIIINGLKSAGIFK